MEEELLYSVVLYYPATAIMNFQSCSLYGTHGVMQTIMTTTLSVAEVNVITYIANRSSNKAGN